MKQGLPDRDTIPTTVSHSERVDTVHTVAVARTCEVRVTVYRDSIPETRQYRVVVAEVPVARAKRNSGGKADAIRRLYGEAQSHASGYGGALIVTNPPRDPYLHKVSSLVTIASGLSASTTALDPTFGDEPRGVMMVPYYSHIRGLPLVVRRAIMACALTRRDQPPLLMSNRDRFDIAYKPLGVGC